MIALAPPEVSVHFTRMVAHGAAGSHRGQEERNRSQIAPLYEETAERAHGLARRIDVPQAQAVFLSGVGMPTIASLARMERDLGKPAVSAAAAMMWNALVVAGVSAPIFGFGSLLNEKRSKP